MRAWSGMIRFKSVTREYANETGGVRALDGIDLEIARGECVAVTGPSGCGKSTLLNILGGLDRPSSGGVWVGETALHTADETALTDYRRHRAGIVFQFFNLLPSMTVRENVGLPLLLRGEASGVAAARVAAMLDLVGLEARAAHFPHQLSGGEMQRAAIARALAGKPDILLADEPTGNLDSANASRVADILLAIAGRGDVTMLVVTHSTDLAARMPRRLAMRDGKIVGDPGA
jgi:putative ABC transport system ATP-binding protein